MWHRAQKSVHNATFIPSELRRELPEMEMMHAGRALEGLGPDGGARRREVRGGRWAGEQTRAEGRVEKARRLVGRARGSGGNGVEPLGGFLVAWRKGGDVWVVSLGAGCG
jgi:hypothetical protein